MGQPYHEAMSGPANDDSDGARPLELLSVVAPVYNEEATDRASSTRACARALEGVPFELVLVDDGSTDGSPLILDTAGRRAIRACGSSSCRATSATRRR